MKSFRIDFAMAAALAMWSMSAQAVRAHFPWLVTDDEGRAVLFFGESPADRAYHLPDSIAAAKVFARGDDAAEMEPVELNLEPVDEDNLIGLRSTEKPGEDAMLEATCQYGIYHGMLLTYYAKHVGGDDPQAWQERAASKELKLDVVPRASKDEVRLTVNWDGKPRKGAGVSLVDSAGEQHQAETDERGEAAFKKIPAGLVGVVVNIDEDAKGELDGEKYTNAGHYATMTFNYRDGTAKPQANDEVSALAPLPEGLASFGAAVADGWLYVYGGHTGEEHAHSRDNLSAHFRRIRLDGGETWEDLPMQTPLQGLPLVSHGGKLYRVGGLNARNGAGEKEDVHSVDEFAAYDPGAGKWTALAPLPERRSSHDAAVIGDKLYVVGGWTLSGDRKGKWLDGAWAFDLTNLQGSWEALPSPGFRRRALAAAEWQGKLVAIGGMNEDAKVSRRVDALDLEAGQWAQLPELPGEEGMDGFGVAAWNLGGDLYVSGTQASLYRLHRDGTAWEPALELKQPRFFHRLAPGERSTLLAIGGASEDGHLTSIEALKPKRERPEQEYARE